MLHLLRTKTPLKIRASLVILTGCLLLQSIAGAQYVEQNQPDHDTKPYYFGITIGINLARFQTNLHPRFMQLGFLTPAAEPTNAGGLALGLLATTRISDRFQLRFNPQLMFLERNIYYKLRFPDIDNQTEVVKKVESIIMTFGCSSNSKATGSEISGSIRWQGLKRISIWPVMPGPKRAEDLVKIDRFDFGPEFGIGFNFFFDSFIFSPEIKISNSNT